MWDTVRREQAPALRGAGERRETTRRFGRSPLQVVGVSVGTIHESPEKIPFGAGGETPPLHGLGRSVGAIYESPVVHQRTERKPIV